MSELQPSERENKSVLRKEDTHIRSTSTIHNETQKESDSIIAGIPVYNEEVSIGSVIVSAIQFVDEVVVIDDGSTDATAQIAADAGATVLKRSENEGKGAAIRTFKRYLKTREFRVAVLLDGDGQHLPRDIPQVVEPVLEDEADLVIGCRYNGGKLQDETPLYRRAGQRLLDIATNTSSRTQLRDSQSGFRALSPKTVEVLSVNSDGYSIESEMIHDASQNGLRIIEKPIDVRYEGVDGQTKNPFYHGLAVLRFLVRLVRYQHPLPYFGVPGAILLFGGSLYVINTIPDDGPSNRAHLLLGTWTTILGGILLVVGLINNSTNTELQYNLESDR